MSPWYGPLRSIESKGSTVEPGGLAGLAEARRQHQGQFWTPEPVVRLMWRVAGLLDADRPVSILDNSFGSGRMFWPAVPGRHRLVGIESDPEVAKQVQAAALAAGFEALLECGSMVDYRCKGRLDIALVNPPFSLHFDSPALEDLGVNSYGRYGPASAARSDRFAIAQALEWAHAVVAVVPRSIAAEVSGHEEWADRHHATLHLPRDSFRVEGADVETSLLVFGSDAPGAPVEKTLKRLHHPAILDPYGSWWRNKDASIVEVSDDSSAPAITMPVTGDKRVRISHNGRRLVLGFRCGAVQARVLNAVLVDRLGYEKIRRPDRVKFQGQGRLDLHCYLAQPDPLGSIDAFVKQVASLGFEPEVDAGVRRWLRAEMRRQAIESVPFRHVARLHDGGLSHWLPRQDRVTGTAHRRVTLWRGAFGSGDAIVEGGERVEFTRSEWDSHKWTARSRSRSSVVDESLLLDAFDIDYDRRPDDWTEIHEGLRVSHPEVYAARVALAKHLGLDRWCSWDYQLEDLCEVSIKRGAIVGWHMGLGKARLAAALCMLGQGRHSLISVESRLVGEMRDEFAVLGVPDDDWQLIEKPEHAAELRRINVITYTRLKSKLCPGGRLTYADRLRRRIHTHVADEGHLLRNPSSQQSRAVWKVSAKRRYVLSGTPVANYPRDILPVLWWVAGDGTRTQPFGRYWSYMTEQNLERVDRAQRGIDQFREMFVTTEWVTNEFSDDLRSGAKREVPKIADVDGFRRIAGVWVKRRVEQEPDVAKFVKIPVPTHVVHEVAWDREHLEFYVRTARDFVSWFREQPEYKLRQGSGLIAVLQQIRAVLNAANFPQGGVKGRRKFAHETTSKQRKAIDLVVGWTQEGRKSIVLCERPAVADWLSQRLEARGVDAVPFHGGVSISRRVKDLDKRFRDGTADVLVATKGTVQTGYNIAQASRVLHVDRDWTPKVELQANARVLRPQQRHDVEIHYLHLPGSIDEYQAQMVGSKACAISTGLDYGAQRDDEEFLHLWTILGRFVEDFEAQRGPLFEEAAA